MGKKEINYAGPSIKDIGVKIKNTNVNNNNANIGVENNSVTNIDLINNGNANNTNGKIHKVINGDGDIGRANINNANIDNVNNANGSIGNVNSDIGIANNDNAVIASTNNNNAKKSYNTVQIKLIRNYIETALGGKDRTEIKISEMINELGINPKTVYKHLKTLRNTEYILTQLQYSTEITRPRKAPHPHQMTVEEAIAMKEEFNIEAH